jgi:2-polyprenyl-3-methyl-5-hydroxy-6-metoxy-1,4-benzoquinol methylase
VPKEGRVLEIGCGHGLFSVLLALQSPAREVLGTDVDGDKVRSAIRVAARAGLSPPNLSFLPLPAGEMAGGSWDAIAIVDVLYLLDAAAEESLLHTAASRLRPGGLLVIKEMAQSPRWKFALARFQERLSVQILRITEGSQLTFVPPTQLGDWMADAGLEVEHRRLDEGYVHPHHLIVGRKPG